MSDNIYKNTDEKFITPENEREVSYNQDFPKKTKDYWIERFNTDIDQVNEHDLNYCFRVYTLEIMQDTDIPSEKEGILTINYMNQAYVELKNGSKEVKY